jgi:hypothetical protein
LAKDTVVDAALAPRRRWRPALQRDFVAALEAIYLRDPERA